MSIRNAVCRLNLYWAHMVSFLFRSHLLTERCESIGFVIGTPALAKEFQLVRGHGYVVVVCGSSFLSKRIDAFVFGLPRATRRNNVLY